VTQLGLGGLDGAGTAALLAAIDRDGVLAARAERIHDQTSGNPLFAWELGRFVLDMGTEAFDAGRAVPQSVRNVVSTRLERLSDPARDLVGSVAVLMHNAEMHVLRSMDDRAAGIVPIEESVASGLLEEQPPDRLEFPHAIVREAVYDSLSTARRTALHARAALALRSRWGDTDGAHLCDVALHEIAAGRPTGAADPVSSAQYGAQWAVDNHRYDLAVVVLTRALPLAEGTVKRELAIRRAVAFQRLSHATLDVASPP
jgi:predicted ATPase